MEFHEAANIFPLDEENLGALAKDIRANGVQVPVEVMDGKILDGRRRWRACEKIGIRPPIKEVKVDDPVAYVLSLNLHRRHLTTGQAAACAARAEALNEKARQEAKERQKRKPAAFVPDNCPEQKSGDSRDRLGEMFGVSGKSVERARKVIDEGIPELINAVDAGKISVNKAQYISTYDKDLQADLLDSELSQEQKTQHKAKPKKVDEPEICPEPEMRGVAILRANEAISCLTRIPKNDALRKRGFQLVTDWIRRNP